MIKLIVSDLDETLVGPNGEISKENIEAIKKATKKGVKFVPNTGRGFESVQDLLAKLELKDKSDEYVISFNGGAIVENYENRVVQTHGLTYNQAKQIFDETVSHPEFATHVYTLDNLYIFNPKDEDLDYIQSRGVKHVICEDNDFTRFKNKPIFKVITMNSDMKKRHEMQDMVTNIVDFPINVTFSSARYTEFNLAGVDKGEATLELASDLGITADEIMALGDNNNDLAMFRKVGCSVAVQNASDDAKQTARYVMDGNYLSGVAEAINRFVLEV